MDAVSYGWHLGRTAKPLFAQRWEAGWDRPLTDWRAEQASSFRPSPRRRGDSARAGKRCLTGPALERPVKRRHVGKAQDKGDLGDRLALLGQVTTRQVFAQLTQGPPQRRAFLLEMALQAAAAHRQAAGDIGDVGLAPRSSAASTDRTRSNRVTPAGLRNLLIEVAIEDRDQTRLRTRAALGPAGASRTSSSSTG